MIDKSFYAVHIIGQEITAQRTAGMHVEKTIEHTKSTDMLNKNTLGIKKQGQVGGTI